MLFKVFTEHLCTTRPRKVTYCCASIRKEFYADENIRSYLGKLDNLPKSNENMTHCTTLNYSINLYKLIVLTLL